MGDYDEDTAFLGQTGPYFWSTFFLLNTVFIPTGFNGLYIVFVGAAPQHHCRVPDLNLSAVWADAVIPVVGEDSSGTQVRSQCSRYQLEVVKNLSDRGLLPGRDVNLSSLEQEECLDGWSFSKEIYQSNIVTEVSGRRRRRRYPGTLSNLKPGTTPSSKILHTLHHFPIGDLAEKQFLKLSKENHDHN